jgi:DNA polymerase II small subunit/DNA polymerase delta subunit B
MGPEEDDLLRLEYARNRSAVPLDFAGRDHALHSAFPGRRLQLKLDFRHRWCATALHGVPFLCKFNGMSFAEMLSEIPRLTPEQRREVLRRVMDADEAAAAEGHNSFCAGQIDGRMVLIAPRTIRQVEVDAILEELP